VWVFSLAGLGLLVWFAPMVVAHTGLRNRALAWVFAGIDGTITAREASLGWFRPVAFEDVTLADPEGKPALHAARVEGRKPLLDLVLGPRELGSFCAVDTRLEVALADGTSNLERILWPWLTSGDPDSLEGTAAEVQVDHATAVIVDTATGASLDVPQWSLWLQSPRRGPDVKLRAKAEGLQLSPELCERGLQYIAPVLAGAARAEGTVSLELSDCRVPTRDPAETELTGKLVVHRAELAGSPLVQSLARVLRFPASARIADGTTIRFQMADRRVTHEGLQLAIGDATVQLDGSVGLDHTLDLVAEVPLTAKLLGSAADYLGSDLRAVRIPITGTLEKPHIDPAALGRQLQNSLRGTAEGALERELSRQLKRLFE
jgi:hypothetical protein